MLTTVLMFSLILLTASIIIALFRVVKGPSMADRVLALDFIGFVLVAIVAVLCIIVNTTAYFTVILLIGILSFVGTISFARFIERGTVIERKHDS
ncbi:Na(+)/H(+) antiporter subunit F1 [Sutcliffiella cohnii]|uniref:Na(+)/H(+) antiporter subunit F n=1 Tax=Sutcliffiella cohnii TaxID=33932 RepID=A0A223KSV8_9BACI|nr:Na(+)/H(+) antiporter subunit F1 [Sutcliffiella cohnii]AST92575.1 Na(+)/H(+) antiporter subunit F [Sutcliffiella cohnii]